MRSVLLAATALLLLSILMPAAADAAEDPVALPFEDGFEGRGLRWTSASGRRAAAVSNDQPFRGDRSLGLTGRKTWGDSALLRLPKLPDQVTYRLSVLPPGESKRAVRAGFYEVAGKKARFYNFVNLRTEDGRTGWVFFKRGLNAKPVQIGKYRAGEWLTIGVHLDFERRLARIWLDGKEAAKDVPILPREFEDPRHGRVVLHRFAVGHRFWLPGAALRAYVDDVRIAEWTGEPPTGEKARAGEVDRLTSMLGREKGLQDRIDAAEGLGKLGDRRAVPALIEALGRDESRLVRQEAARALGLLGDHRATEALLSALEDESGGVRRAAVLALAKLGPPAAAALVAKLASSDREGVRRAAGDALVEIGGAAVDAIVPLLGHEQALVRTAAVGILSVIGDERAVDPLVAVLREDASPQVRGDAVRALGRLEDVRAFEPLVAAIGDRDRGVRRLAVEALGNLGDPRGVPHVVKALADRDSQIRIIAANALGSIGGAEAVAPLVRALGDESEMVRATAVHALGKVQCEGALTALVDLLQSEDPEMRAGAAGALGTRGDGSAIGALAGRLRDPSVKVRQYVAFALEQLGWRPGTKEESAWFFVSRRRFTAAARLGIPAIEPLIAALTDADSTLRHEAAQALPAVGPVAIGPLLAVEDHEDPEVRRLAALALEKLGHRPGTEEERARRLVRARKWVEAVLMGKAAVAPLVEALRETDEDARTMVAYSLEKLGWKPSTDVERAWHLVARGRLWEAAALGKVAFEPLVNALPTSTRVLADLGDPRAFEPLASLLAHEDERIQVEAALALGALGDERGVEALRKAMDDPRPEHRTRRRGFAAGLWRLGAEDALEVVIEGLRDRSAKNRAQAAWLLTEIAPDSEAAVRALEGVRKDESWRVRLAAAKALVAIWRARRAGERDDYTAVLGNLGFELRKGDSWEYACEEDSGRIRVTGVYRDGVAILEAEGMGDEMSTMTWRSDGAFLVWDWFPFFGLRSLRFDAEPGDEWESHGDDLLGHDTTLVSKLEAIEEVRTSAGTFSCRKVVTRDEPGGYRIVMWWAKVGIVKVETPGGGTWTLTSYRVGGKD